METKSYNLNKKIT